ncbi:MAG: SRPBCC domain-containing protein [Myxococcales bacterium]|nr:SRPBCC domain-containing protein [Myxococcales bacterium]
MSAFIHQEVAFSAPPARIYRALMDSAEHAEFTGGPAQISAEEGGACSWHGGQITGRNIELVPDQRIVQAWRAMHWDQGVYSIVRFELRADGAGTRLILEQAGHPEGSGEHLESGWQARYWEPLTTYLAEP